MRGILLFSMIFSGALTAQTAQTAHKPARRAAVAAHSSSAASLTTDDQKTVYAIGVMMYRSLAQFNLTPAELAIVKRALSDSQAGKPALDIAPWVPKIQTMARSRGEKIAEQQKAAGDAYLAKAAAEPGAVKLPSGLIYHELRPGTGPAPKPADTVKVNYRGTLINGTEFDSSYKRHEPTEFPLNGVIKCWTEGVQKMKVGGKSRLVCPADLAYGERSLPGIPAGSTLIFDIELLSVGGK